MHPALPDQDDTIERSHLPYFRLLQAIAVCACARFAGLVSSGGGASLANGRCKPSRFRRRVFHPLRRCRNRAREGHPRVCGGLRNRAAAGRLGRRLRGRRVLHRRHIAHARAVLLRSPAAASMDRARHRRRRWRRLVAEAAVLADGTRHQRSPIRADAPGGRTGGGALGAVRLQRRDLLRGLARWADPARRAAVSVSQHRDMGGR